MSTMLMQDAVTDAGVSVGDGLYNQEAVFANPFKAMREEALVVNLHGVLTYLERTDTSETGWLQTEVCDADGAAYALAEVVVAQHASGDLWAICSPTDQDANAFALKLGLQKPATGDDPARCSWSGQVDLGVPAFFARSLCVSYSPQSGPLILGAMLSPSSGFDFALTAQLPTPSGATGPWAPVSAVGGGLPYPVVGGGLLPVDPRSGKRNVLVRYYLNGQQLLRVDFCPDGTAAVTTTVASNVAQVCGSFYVPYLNHDNPQGDVGCMYLRASDNDLVTAYSNKAGAFHYETVSGLTFAGPTRCWQDADGLLHVFGIDDAAALQVLHQATWQAAFDMNGYPVTRPQWTSAAVAGAPAGIGGFALADASDRMVAFDFTGSGKSDHLLAYGPGNAASSVAASVLAHTADGTFSTVGTPAVLPGLNAASTTATPLDYTGSGSQDHLLITAGLPAAQLFQGVDGVLTALGPSGPITENAPFQAADAIVAFDYTGLGHNDHLLVYRPGAGLAWLLAPTGDAAGHPYRIVAAMHGIGTFDLMNAADRIVGLDYDSSGSWTHLLIYRPGTGTVYIVTTDDKGAFTTVLASHSGIGGYDLAVSEDRLLAFDYTCSGFDDHILAYRPGNIPGHSDQQVWVLERTPRTNTYTQLKPPSSTHGMGGYNFADPADRVVGLDYIGTGGLCYLVAYRPGAGKVSVMGQRGVASITPVYQAPPAPAAPVTVGLHTEVIGFQLDPYPDYKPSELIKMSGVTAQEAYCVCTQDVTTSQWQLEKVRIPAPDPANPPAPVMVSHYVAQATLVDTRGLPMPGYAVNVTADTLVEAQMGGISYQVGPGRPVAVATDSHGRLTVSIAARGLNPPVVHLAADGLASGEAVSFATQVNDFLAGKATLPSQSGTFTPDLLATASCTPNAPGLESAPLADWAALKQRGLTPEVVVDHCTTMYGMAGGNKALPKAVFEGFDAPQPIVGYVIQLWDPEQPAFQAFRTDGELEAYRARRTTHPAYGGWWDDAVSWADDVWEGIKSGAAKVAEVIVTTVVEIAVWVGDAVVSLGEIVIDAIEQAVHAVEAVFQMIADAIARVIDWLKALFAFGDIWDTKTAMQGMLNQVPDQIKAAAQQYGWVTAAWFAGQRSAVHQKLMSLKDQYADTRMGDFDNKVPPLTSADGAPVQPHAFKDNPQAAWARNRFMGDSAQLHLSTALGAVALPDALEDAFRALVGVMTGGTPSPIDGFTAAIEKFGTAVSDLFDPDAGGNAAIADLIDCLDDVAGAILTFLGNVVAGGLQFVTVFADALGDLLDTPLDLGPLNVLWDWFMDLAGHPGEPLTLSSVFCLVAGFFVTVIYKLVMGVDNPPFPGGLFPVAPAFGADPTASPRVPFLPDGGACYGFNIAAELLTATVFNGLEVATNFTGDNAAMNWAYWFFGMVAFVGFPMPWTFTSTRSSSWWGPWFMWALSSGIGACTIKFGAEINKDGSNTVLKQWGKLGAATAFGIGASALALSALASDNEQDPPWTMAAAILGCVSTMTAPLIVIADSFKDPKVKAGILIAKSVVDVLCNAASGILSVVYNSIAVDGRVRLTYTGASPGKYGAYYCELPDAFIGMTYSGNQLAATGKYPPFSYALGKGTPFSGDAGDQLPDGMTWTTVTDNDGKQQFVLGGAPSNPQQVDADFGVWATDSNSYPPFNAALECYIAIYPAKAGSAAITGGDNQSAQVSAQYASLLAVTVKNTNGQLLPGAAVTFTAPAGGASGTFPGGVTSVTVTTDAHGTATAPAFVANGVTGPVRVTAAVPGVSQASVAFTLTNTASTVQMIQATTGSGQAYSGQVFNDSLQATVIGPGSTPLANVQVTFTCPSAADGSFVNNQQQTIVVLTDGNGVAHAGAFRAGTIAAGGPQIDFTVTAAVVGSAAKPAAFALTVLPLSQPTRRNSRE
ncbi:hypothetical protein KDL01_27535 [Actinospica durhamensis]|uniref:Big-1 domain-containing protein n=1 Tax=Actinospica durhamensis TaxID=1508375 RepID=A0A941IPY5_9ACTN|nr:hypothetical protein [Actinospica durhamensis]MBR7837060.1 hypothetical protein [Actinospica durhamensis]